MDSLILKGAASNTIEKLKIITKESSVLVLGTQIQLKAECSTKKRHENNIIFIKTGGPYKVRERLYLDREDDYRVGKKSLQVKLAQKIDGNCIVVTSTSKKRHLIA